MNVLVIGAGPVGLSAALALCNRNIACRIVERRDAPSELSRAVGIMPGTIQALERLGIGSGIQTEGMAIHRMTLKQGHKALMSLDVTKGKLGKDHMIGLPQNRTEEILRDALQRQGVDPEYGVTVSDVATTQDSATVTFEDGTQQTFDWVIAADGVGSTTRKALGIAYPGKDLPDEWSIADVDLSGPFDENGVTVYIQGNGQFGMVLPIAPKRARIVSSTSDALAALPEPVHISHVRRKATFTISVRQAEVYDKGRVLLAGDAAHCHSPVGGKGMNLGIADGIAAAQAIADGTTDQYTAQRHAAGARVMAASEFGRKIITSDRFTIKALTRVATWLAGHVPTIGRLFMRNLTQL